MRGETEWREGYDCGFENLKILVELKIEGQFSKSPQKAQAN